jgi:hypothetical protein
LSYKFTKGSGHKLSALVWYAVRLSTPWHSLFCGVQYLLLTLGTCQKTTELPQHGLFALSAVLPHKSLPEPER